MPDSAGDLQANSADRDNGRFRKGRSGNPGGRQAGSRNKTTRLAQDLLDGSAEKIIETVVRLAKKGDPVALRLAVDRILPRQRDRVVELEFTRRVEQAVDVADAAALVIERAAAGEITLEEAKEFMALLESQRKHIETADLAIRIEVIERELQGGGE